MEVTSKDVDLAEKAFGPDTGNLKGKTTQSTPEVIYDQTMQIPEELLDVNRDIILSADGMSSNNLNFLTTILHGVYHRTATHLPSTGHV